MSEVEMPEVEQKPDQSGSIMEQLRARHSELLDSQTHDFEVPGYQGEMVTRCRVLDSADMSRISNLIRKQIKNPTEQQFTAALDIIVRSCVEIFYAPPTGGDLVPLSKVIGVPTEVRFDEHLASFLGHEVETAREALLVTFGNNEVAIMRFAMTLQDWMSDTTKVANGDFAGEL